MSVSDVSVFHTTVQKSNIWIQEMQEALPWDADAQDAYHTLRAGLHFLRDRLSPEEAAHLSAQLPMLIRGLFYEGWDPSGKPLTIDDYDDLNDSFLSMINRDIPQNPPLILRAVFEVLANNITAGEMKHIQSMLPEEMRTFWPNEVRD